MKSCDYYIQQEKDSKTCFYFIFLNFFRRNAKTCQFFIYFVVLFWINFALEIRI
jgi:hypothetical protein